jgi:hypothetical protein
MEIKFLSGYKTYIVAIIMIIWAIYAGTAKIIAGEQVVQYVLQALAIIGFRSAIARLESK